MPTTAWRFKSTEGADDAVFRLKALDAQEMINLHDAAVIRWPQYAAEPIVQEHVIEAGTKISSLVSRLRRATIEGSMIDTVKGDLTPGTSAVVLLSSEASIDAVVHAFEGTQLELIRSDLSVPEQDQLRAAIAAAAAGRQGPPPGTAS